MAGGPVPPGAPGKMPPPPAPPRPPAHRAVPAPPARGKRTKGPPPLGFWQQPWVQNILPFVTSLAVHAAIIILMIIVIGVTREIIKQVKAQEQTIIPDASLAETMSPGGVPNVGLANNPFEKAMQNTTPDGGTPEGWAKKAGALDKVAAAEGGGAGDSNPSALGLIGGGTTGRGRARPAPRRRLRRRGRRRVRPPRPVRRPRRGAIGPRGRCSVTGGTRRGSCSCATRRGR